MIPEAGEDSLKHFAGARECGISESDIYHAPAPIKPQATTFCKNRATLLEALGGGGRHGFNEPYVGKGCTYRWFSAPEICMILERFNTVVFIGDSVSQSVYSAFNILLREDLALGSLQQWMMNDQDRLDCKCDNQFLNPDCLRYSVRNMRDIKKIGDKASSPYFCERIPHAYIPIASSPASTATQSLFKDLTYGRPNPWQPTPLIFSFGNTASFSTPVATQYLDEWASLAAGAERNAPLLLLGPPAFGPYRSHNGVPRDGNTVVWSFTEQMKDVARARHFEVLSFFNLTLQAGSLDGERYGMDVALVEAMMVINWLSKLETS